MSDWVNETAVHVDLNHLIYWSELRVFRHGHIEGQVLAKES